MFRGSAYSIETDKDHINNSEVLEEEVIRIALLGGPDVGKTSMLACIENQPFQEDIAHTKILQPRFKKLRINNNCIISLYTWDGPGQKMPEYLNDGTLNAIDGFLQVFDLTDRHSLHMVEAMHYDLKNKNKEFANRAETNPLCCILVGNKADEYSSANQVPDNSIKQTDYLADRLARRERLLYLKTSAKSNSFVKDAFVELIKQILRFRKKNKSGETRKSAHSNISYEDYQFEQIHRQGKSGGPSVCRRCKNWCFEESPCRLF